MCSLENRNQQFHERKGNEGGLNEKSKDDHCGHQSDQMERRDICSTVSVCQTRFSSNNLEAFFSFLNQHLTRLAIASFVLSPAFFHLDCARRNLQTWKTFQYEAVQRLMLTKRTDSFLYYKIFSITLKWSPEVNGTIISKRKESKKC